MRGLLESAKAATGSAARLVWAPPDVIERAGIAPWTELPVWVPPDSELIGLHTGDVSAVYATGLRCRPIEQTVSDTWAWLQAETDPPSQPGRPAHGVTPEREREALAMLTMYGAVAIRVALARQPAIRHLCHRWRLPWTRMSGVARGGQLRRRER